MNLPKDGLHPAAFKLDAVAAGDESGPIAAHLEGCEACAEYVGRMTMEAAAFRARVDPEAFVKVVHTRAAKRRRGAILRVAGPGVAIAAAFVFWLRTTPGGPGSAVVPLSASVHDGARFKGELAVAVVRERGGRQERLIGPFEVLPSDRIRIEIAVDREEAITAGLLSNDGTWTVLEAPVALSAGTHYSELAARFDGTPTDAWLLVGSPADVERSRGSRNFESVVAWRVRSAPVEEPPK